MLAKAQPHTAVLVAALVAAVARVLSVAEEAELLSTKLSYMDH